MGKMISKHTNSKEPTVIFFDLGKVLVDFDFNLAYNFIKARSALPVDEFDKRIPTIEELNIAYEAGEIETTSFFQSMAETLEFNGTIDLLASTWSDIFEPMSENIELVKLLAVAYPLAIISNTSDAHIQLLEANYSFFNHFRERIYSHIIGYRKPDTRIYEHSRNVMGAEPRNSIFIDDRIENIRAAAKLGWMTIYLNGEVDLRQALIEAGVELPSNEPSIKDSSPVMSTSNPKNA
jgi:FMN phosphatase YigB (HAD superfamily)